MGWKHYQTVYHPKWEPQVVRGLFGIRVLILHFKFQFFQIHQIFNISNSYFPQFTPSFEKKISPSQDVQKSPKNLLKITKRWLMKWAERFSVRFCLFQLAIWKKKTFSFTLILCGKKTNGNVDFRGMDSYWNKYASLLFYQVIQLRTHSAAARESTTFPPLWWRVWLSMRLHTALNHIRFVKLTA